MYGVKKDSKGGVRALNDGIIIGKYEAMGLISVEVLKGDCEVEESNMLEVGMFFGSIKIKYVSINNTIFVQVDEDAESRTHKNLMALKAIAIQNEDKKVFFCPSMESLVKKIGENL